MSLRFSHAATPLFVSLLAVTTNASAAQPTAGYQEAVVQWVTQPGETCAAISQALYASPDHPDLVRRYNKVDCAAPLAEGQTLVLPAAVTTLPDAKIRSVSENVQQKPSGGGWSPASTGMPLFKNHSVNTQEKGRADIEFTDRTRIFLAENTLVVLYGTAARTSVKHNVNVEAVELEKGELKAGLAALRGDSVDVAIAGGGSVKAASKDVVVQRQGERTTVEVFDGKAAVTAAGKQIDVPTNFGTRFVAQKPPTPPRPLPPAPIWDPGNDVFVLAPESGGTIATAWKPVDKAKLYRVEIARDAEFRDLLAREEVPANVNSFRAEGLPAGTYHLAVRAIDDEDYLGIASQKRSATVVTAAASGGASLQGATLEATPYSTVTLGALPKGVTFAENGGAFGPAPSVLDLGADHPSKIAFRSADGVTSEIAVHFHDVTAQVSATREGNTVRVRATLTGADGIDVVNVIKPKLVVKTASGSSSARVQVTQDRALLASIAGDSSAMQIEIRDDRGILLGGTELSPEGVTPESPTKPKVPIAGVDAPLLTLSSVTDVAWTAPTPRDAVSTSASVDRKDGRSAAVGIARVQGSAGPVGIDATLTSNATDGARDGDSVAWLGARVRTIRIGNAAFESAIGVRAGLPASVTGPDARVEPSVSFGGVAGRVTWVADVGARIRVEDGVSRASTPAGQGFLLAGATYDFLPPLRGYGLFDVHAFGGDGTDVRGRGGFTAGLEAGRVFFGDLGVRVTPWADLSGPVTVHLALGLRAP